MVPIVIVAYNRPKSLERLLNSLVNAEYNDEKVTLIISIDKGNNRDVLEIADKFNWQCGEKIVLYQEKNLGLKNHIIKCASLSNKYNNVIILEDDLYVAPDFYNYAMQALEFAKDKKYIGGISLYNHQRNVLCAEPFSPIEDGYDNYYFQFASSWGQAWTNEQWKSFMKWYDSNHNKKIDNDNFPQYISNWPETSWLKYFIKYLVDNDKYFIYPKISLTTNFGDKGTHMGSDNTDYQVPLLRSTNKKYIFSNIEESNAVYDVFFENVNLHKLIENNQTCIDLYGCKLKYEERYILTRKLLNYKIVNSFGCSLRPHDLNVIDNIQGNDFNLYDTSIEVNNYNRKKEKSRNIRKINYCIKLISREKHIILIKIFLSEILESIKRKINR